MRILTAPRPHQPDPVSPALVFLAVLGGLLALTATIWAARPDLGGRVKAITRADRPSDDYYLAHDRVGHVIMSSITAPTARP